VLGKLTLGEKKVGVTIQRFAPAFLAGCVKSGRESDSEILGEGNGEREREGTEERVGKGERGREDGERKSMGKGEREGRKVSRRQTQQTAQRSTYRHAKKKKIRKGGKKQCSLQQYHQMPCFSFTMFVCGVGLFFFFHPSLQQCRLMPCL